MRIIEIWHMWSATDTEDVHMLAHDAGTTDDAQACLVFTSRDAAEYATAEHGEDWLGMTKLIALADDTTIDDAIEQERRDFYQGDVTAERCECLNGKD